jgi:hypothetical protein
MKIELVVALVSGAVALCSVVLTIWGQVRTQRVEAQLQDLRTAEQRQFEARKTIARYREPLARAAYDLQSRMYGILELGLINSFLNNGDDREKFYIVNNTVFLVAQYFAWTEIIRSDIQFIDLGRDDQTRQLARLQDSIYSLWQTDSKPRYLRVFAGEQRAIGERLIQTTSRGQECIGYAAFLDRLDKGSDPLINALMKDVQELANHLSDVRLRLIWLQNALIDLLEFLDPDYIRFRKERRTKVTF